MALSRSCPPGADATRSATTVRVAGLLVVLLLALCGGVAVVAGIERSAAVRAEDRQLRSETDVLAAYVGEDLSGLRDVTQAWAQREQVADALRAAAGGRLVGESRAMAVRIAESLRLARGGTLSAFFVDARGVTVAGSPRGGPAVGTSSAQTEWFREAVASGAPLVTSAHEGGAAGEPWVIAAAAPVFDVAGPSAAGPAPGSHSALLGVVVSTMDVSELQDLAQTYLAGHGRELVVLDTAGNLLTGPGTAGGVALAAGRSGAGAYEALVRAARRAPAPGAPAGEALAGPAAVGAGLGAGQDAQLAAAARVPGTEYVVVTTRLRAEVLASTRASIRALAVGAAVVWLLALLGAVLWQRVVGARRRSVQAEQQRLRAVYDASPSGIVELALDLTILAANSAFLGLLGRSESQVLGRRGPDLFHRDGPAATPEALTELADGSRAAFTSHRLLARADGAAVPVQLDWGVVRDESGAALRLVCVVTDVSEQAALRTDLERARERAEVLWRESPVGVIEGTPEGTVISANAAFARMFGYEQDELVGVDARTLAVPEQAPVIAVGTERLKRGESYVVERRYLHKDGTQVPVLTSATVLKDPSGAVERFAGFVVDLTELHAQRQEVQSALEQVARQRAFIEAVLETVDVGIVYVDADGTGMTRNRAERAMSFLPPDYDGGRPQQAGPLIDLLDSSGSVVDPEDYPLVRVMRGEDPEPFDGRLGPAGGPHRDVVIRASRITGADGEVLGAVVALTDVTAERSALRALSAERAALAEAQRVGQIGSFSVDPATGEWTMSDQLYELWGHPTARPGVSVLRQQVVDAGPDALAPAVLTGGRSSRTFRVRHAATGEERILVATTEVTLDDDGAPVSITGTHHDVTELTEAERSATEARSFFEAALVATPDYTFITDLATGAVVYGTPGKQILGLSSERLQALGAEAIAELIHPDDQHRLRALNVAAGDLDDGQALQLQYRARHVDGSWHWLSRRVTAFRRDRTGRVTQVLGVVRDVTDVVQAEDRLRHTALHDGLTGLPNRALLHERLGEALARAREAGEELAVLFLDLDGFKRINDSHGHGDGDEVLRVTAARLRQALREQDTVARVGGDEFVVLVQHGTRAAGDERGATADGPGPDGEPVSMRDFAAHVAGRLVAVVAEPIAVGEQRHVVTASVGVRVVSPDATSPDGRVSTAETVLQDADTAMYDAKGHGKDGVVVFEAGLRDDLAERARVERELRSALAGVPVSADLAEHRAAAPVVPVPRAGPERAVLRPAYQPVFDRDCRLVGVEALARLTTVAGEGIAPDSFIAVAEQTGLVRRLGALMLDAACAQAAQWRTQHAGFGDTTMSVNVSAVEVNDPRFAARVLDTLARHDLPGAALVLELTETVLLQADDAAITSLTALREHGIGISIDDFGTGYASLRYLVTLPVTAVKVDGSFTAGLPDDVMKTRVVLAVCALAADLGLGCVVEGVETVEQADATPAGASLQGYLLGRPAFAEHLDLAALLPVGRP